MKKFYNIFKKALVLIGVVSMTSCDFLGTEPYDFVSQPHSIETSLNVPWHLPQYITQWQPPTYMVISIPQK